MNRKFLTARGLQIHDLRESTDHSIHDDGASFERDLPTLKRLEGWSLYRLNVGTIAKDVAWLARHGYFRTAARELRYLTRVAAPWSAELADARWAIRHRGRLPPLPPPPLPAAARLRTGVESPTRSSFGQGLRTAALVFVGLVVMVLLTMGCLAGFA